MATNMTAADVSRLLGRVAFGATSADLDYWTGKPYGDLVDSLLQVATLPTPPPLPDDAVRLERIANDGGIQPAQEWWLERMRTTPFPLLERMTLLWHGHFATGVRYPPTTAEMLVQNQTLRANALGSVRELVATMTVDDAMLWWLNGIDNAIPHPNENYAREFFELFTLGKRPQVYTEKDIRNAARAFTGWVPGSWPVPSQFSSPRHDPGTKHVLGKTITNLADKEYLALVDLALAQPVSARFFAYKLLANLAYVPAVPNLLRSADPLLNRVAAKLKSTDWDVAEVVRTLLMSEEFRHAPASKGRQLVRQPVETVVHAAKALGVSFTGSSLTYALDRMGQSVFNPVNVGGWPLGKDWISPVTAIARYDAGLTLYNRAAAAPAAKAQPLPAANDLKAWAKRLGLAGFGANTTSAVNGYLRRVAKSGEPERAAGVLTLLLSSPEWVVM
jgi:uncharacterized protein (DUF1800 family)